MGCGGTILDSETILTAAHCIENQPNLNLNYFVEAGITITEVNDIGGSAHGQLVGIESYTIHPNYTGLIQAWKIDYFGMDFFD